MALLTIGEFSRASYLTIKTLRHYHDVGLLEPAQADSSSGYRYYRADQIATGRTIRRLRELEMPLEQVKGVLQAADAGERNALIAAHLERMEQRLERATAVDELAGTLAASSLRPAGNCGALYAQDVFEQAHGEVVVFVRIADRVTATGRARPITVPAAELAVTIHHGAHDDFDRSYPALGRYLAEHDLKAEEPVREYYLVGPRHTDDASQWQTEIAWPVARTH
jgi:DNA-binding transcriptional MerR regulator